ncbi:phosphomannomutase/phosphoglucomutase [Cellulosimicrobium cellulans]|uniref:phosphomannomutase/phosphoglucomutase n=1 Tax=Cellulosimicrobium cellulans TaxID=1710 RepID=UPI00209688E2|nr:phosphomannomutase/phosphoglucomutase [Cellulosimicrobium cellulans]MCO7272644.1 phosphomannomutase/phosphoglucomutase [Cellulosimicrobium cellulans]
MVEGRATDLTAHEALRRVVKAYDVRGVVPDELNDDVVRALGAAFVETVVRPGADGVRRVVVARDMRESGPGLLAAFVDGAREAGAHVLDAGLCSTDELYLASGLLDAAGAMFTASHNPARYNGIKLCLSGARPVGQDTGLRAVRDRADELLAGDPVDAGPRGGHEAVDVLRSYAERLRSLVDLSGGRRLRVVVDAGNGMAGLTVPAVLGMAAGLPPLPLGIVPLFFELDGSFPHHEANPLVPANTAVLQAEVVRRRADLGLAFDGDADRCFVVDERGRRVDPSVLTTLVGLREARRVRGEGGVPVVLHNAITSRAVPEILGAEGVRTVRTRVGHSFIKALMASEDAVFGGEHSGHFYFRDFLGADSGLLAAMHVLAALSEQDRPLSDLVGGLDPYVRSGEVDVAVADPETATAAVLEVLGEAYDAASLDVDELDGTTVRRWHGDDPWWLNLRASNTEPVLRLNVEAADVGTMRAVRDRVLDALATVPAEGGGPPSGGATVGGGRR